MASIKVKFRPSTVADREGTIYYQIIHERKSRQLVTAYHIFPDEWDERQARVVARRDDRYAQIDTICENIRFDMERITKIIGRLESERMGLTVDDIVDGYDRYVAQFTLGHFMERIIVKLKLNGRLRTAETYRAALNSFRTFLSCAKPPGCLPASPDMMLDRITAPTMENYEAWLRRRSVVPNTISFYGRILRAAYNRAVAAEIIDDRRPFRSIYTGIDKTKKRALPLTDIKRINDLDLSHQPALDYARDIFMLSFMLRGMSFIDMAFLKKTDLANGSITYRRRKTGRELIISWTPQMQTVLDKYPPNTSRYLLPIIRRHGTSERSVYRNAAYNINRALKQIAAILAIPVPLTLYVARHSWASAAHAKGIPLSVISEGMGHDSETTTRIYLSALDTSVIDRANSLILSSL